MKPLFLYIFFYPAFISAAMLDLAFDAHRNGDLERAEKYYYQALEEGGNQAVIYYNLGNLNYTLSRLGDAVLNYRRAIEAAPSFKGAYLNLGRINYLYGNYNRALEVFQDYQKQDPGDYENTLLLADTYKKLRIYLKALEQYRKAVKINPYNEEGYIALADFYLDFDDMEGARKEVLAGYDNVGFSKSLLLYEADLLRETGRYDEAVSVYRSILQSDRVTNFSFEEKYDIEFKIVDSLLSASNVNYALFELERIVEKYPLQQTGIAYLENIYIVHNKISRGFAFFKKLYPQNRLLIEEVIKDFLADAYNRDDLFLVKSIVAFYEQKKLSDDLVTVIKNQLSL